MANLELSKHGGANTTRGGDAGKKTEARFVHLGYTTEEETQKSKQTVNMCEEQDSETRQPGGLQQPYSRTWRGRSDWVLIIKTKTRTRSSIAAGQRLLITLRFLTTGE